MTGKPLSRDAAETIAYQIVAFLAADEDRWAALLAQTGLDAAALRAGLADAGFLAEIVRFLMRYEKWAAAFCDGIGAAEDILWRVQAALDDGAADWR